MNNKVKENINTKKIFYLATVISLLIFIIGIIVTITSDGSTFNVLNSNYFDMLTIFVPFSMWAWLVVLGTLFVKKIGIVRLICIILAIPHIIVIAVMLAYSNIVFYILKWYMMILSFGSIII